MSKIAIFDSGVGGITVLEELYRLLPNEEYIYFGDSANAPYGDKTNDEIRKYTYAIIEHFFQYDIKMLVIACNTVTSFMYKELVDTLDVPVIGVIYPTVNYVNKLNISSVGLIATSRTIENNTYQKLINKHVESLATPQFVPMVEDNSYINKADEIETIISQVTDKNIQAIVLGCTHYPYFKNIIESFYAGIIVDSGTVTAIDVKDYLLHNDLFGDYSDVLIHVSGNVDDFEKVISNYVSFNYEIKHVEV